MSALALVLLVLADAAAVPPEPTLPEPGVIELPVEAPVPRDPPATGLGERLVAESEVIRELLDGTSATLLVLLVAALFGVVELVSRVAHAARASVFDVGRRLTGLRIVAVVAVGIWGVSLVARYVMLRAPLVGTALLVVFAGGALFGVAHSAQRAAAGLLLLLGHRIREGDRVTVGETTGTVEHAGPMRLRLRRADGAVVWLPTSALADAAVVVSSPRATQIVEVLLERDRALAPEEREHLRRVAVSCPFREAGTEVSVEDAGRGVRISLRAWSSGAAARAESWLRASAAPTTPRGPTA